MSFIPSIPTRFRTWKYYLSLITILLTVVALVFGLGQSSLAQAGTAISFNSVADSYVNQSSPTANYGANTTIRVDGSPNVRSFLRFNVTGVNGTVSKATLSIYANSASSVGFSVKQVADNSWQEAAVSYNKSPVLGELIVTTKGYSANTWVNADVTAYIKANGTYSLALVTASSTATSLASRESGAHAPKLVIETVGSPIPTVVSTNVPKPTATATTLATSPVLPTPSTDIQPAFPIRAAFFYPWFPEGWNQQSFNPFTNYHPSLGFYDSSSVPVIQNQIKAMTYGNITAAILSWWGQGSPTDKKVSTILAATPGSSNPNFRWSIYYENESMGDPSQSQIQSDISYIQNNYGKNPSFLRVNGKFVIFVYSDTNDACGMADRWVLANKAVGSPAYVVLKVFPGYLNCANQPSSWHQYSPAVATDDQKGFSYAIAPGFYKKGDAVRLGRDLARWTANVTAMVASGEKWQLVTTFNEWGEGTSVESATEWASASGYGLYLDALHANGGSVPKPGTTATIPPAPTNVPTKAPTQVPTQGPTQVPTQGPTQAPTIAPTPPPGNNGNDPIIFFTGDLVSSSSVARAQLVVKEINNLMAQHPGTKMLVASTGDNEQENNPTVANYQAYFGATYGPFVNQGIFMQIRGNHDIQSAGSYTDFNGTTHASGGAYWTYFGANAHAANISGQKLTDYSYDLGGWHIIGLDQLNGSVNAATLNFLSADLSSHASNKCQLVYWHVPTYSSGAAHGDSTGLKALNQAEYNAGVDIQINGHDHNYQRFYPLNPSGQRDDAKGITTFIDGIGGQDGRSGSQTSIAQPASALYLDAFPGGEAIGVIQFTLHANSADYKLYDANTSAVLDQGTVTCH
jgi:hypothetical protein